MQEGYWAVGARPASNVQAVAHVPRVVLDLPRQKPAKIFAFDHWQINCVFHHLHWSALTCIAFADESLVSLLHLFVPSVCHSVIQWSVTLFERKRTYKFFDLSRSS